jgi:hypothetical protein
VVRDFRSIDSVAPFTVDVKDQLDAFTLENSNLKASFDSNGLLSAISHGGRETASVSIQFVHYGTRRGNEPKSGAYLFLPDGPGRVVESSAEENGVRIVEGSIRSQVVVTLPLVVHQVTLHRSPGIDGVHLDIDNLVNFFPDVSANNCTCPPGLLMARPSSSRSPTCVLLPSIVTAGPVSFTT